MSLIAASVLLSVAAGNKFPIEPEFTYNGIDRPFNVRINGGRAQKLSLRIYRPEKNETVDEAEVKSGKIDLAKTFPNLWKSKKAEVLYLQLIADGKSAGPSLVMQPMTNPPVVTLDSTTKAPKWEPDEDNTYAGIRCWEDQNVVLVTEFGEAEFKMRPDSAPNTVWNFIQLVQGGFYRDIIFHRIAFLLCDMA